MIKIKAVAHWTDTHSLHQRLIHQFIPYYDNQDLFTFVDDHTYDYLLMFNIKKENVIHCPKANVFGFLQEPPDNPFVDRSISNHCGQAFVCSSAKYYDHHYQSAPARMFYHMWGKIGEYANNNNFQKPKKLSVVLSGKRGNFYEMRHDILHAIFNSDLDCDIYGHSISTTDSRYKGSPENKADCLLPYEYSVAIENGRWDGYISEKFFDCLLCNTIPIYLGAPDIDSYFKGAYIELPIVDVAKKLKEIISTPNADMQPKILAAKSKWIKDFNLFDLVLTEIKSRN